MITIDVQCVDKESAPNYNNMHYSVGPLLLGQFIYLFLRLMTISCTNKDIKSFVISILW